MQSQAAKAKVLTEVAIHIPFSKSNIAYDMMAKMLQVPANLMLTARAWARFN